jgi:hypothetical protein
MENLKHASCIRGEVRILGERTAVSHNMLVLRNDFDRPDQITTAYWVVDIHTLCYHQDMKKWILLILKSGFRHQSLDHKNTSRSGPARVDDQAW